MQLNRKTVKREFGAELRGRLLASAAAAFCAEAISLPIGESHAWCSVVLSVVRRYHQGAASADEDRSRANSCLLGDGGLCAQGAARPVNGLTV